MQFVIHTANLIARDWRNKTQGVFSTGILHKKASEHLHSTCAFERDLQDYLSRYQNMVMTARVSQFDFSGVKGVLVASVPGSFSGQERNRWGHMRLRSVLRQQVELSQEARERSKIIIQISSIGSLGPEATDWLRGEFEVSLNAHRNQTYGGRGSGELAIVYPTVENTKAYEKQAHYLQALLHKWKADESGRERAMPHIKTFTRLNSQSDGDYLSWILLTSANLSKPAWGFLTKKGSLDIKSYELGVLLYPSLFEPPHDSAWEEGSKTVMINSTQRCPQPVVDMSRYADKVLTVVPIRLPYDLPLTPYDRYRDHVWLSDKWFPGLDDYGKELQK
ncbi:hypothetical protein DFQ27_003949 [Actinomortierella ambigua]|uniref:Tyrosyl-DNA phosphodiesterase n=1 Tax=Actinomortierella ambigua TaxID=1343610 RepID=A0A9P6Q576_9FUNG|nr:hypothetical protein DFQ27_003949 [Actinomortierella ambigua]